MAESACPRRQFMDDPEIQWREGKPDYTKLNKTYLEGRTRKHKEGSLEKIVEDLVKTWEMEASHKIRVEVRKKLGFQKPTAVIADKFAVLVCFRFSLGCPRISVDRLRAS